MPLHVFNTLSLILGLILLMQSLREFGNQPLSYFTEEKTDYILYLASSLLASNKSEQLLFMLL